MFVETADTLTNPHLSLSFQPGRGSRSGVFWSSSIWSDVNTSFPIEVQDFQVEFYDGEITVTYPSFYLTSRVGIYSELKFNSLPSFRHSLTLIYNL